jgi:predicted nucleic acid-binding protein
VGSGLILETTFLIDLEREALRSQPGVAHAFLVAHEDAPLFLTFVVVGELATGYPANGRPRWEQLLAPFHVLPCTPDVCWRYGQADRHLRSNGMLIGANDLWIAASGLAYGMPIVTRNDRHFRRVPDLEVVRY